MEMEFNINSNVGVAKEELEAVVPMILKEWGLVAEGYAKINCPVDTGRLRNSLTHDVRSAEGAVYIGSNVEYAPYVEYGTSRMNAQPYLAPAITQNVDEYYQIAEDYLKGN